MGSFQWAKSDALPLALLYVEQILKSECLGPISLQCGQVCKRTLASSQRTSWWLKQEVICCLATRSKCHRDKSGWTLHFKVFHTAALIPSATLILLCHVTYLFTGFRIRTWTSVGWNGGINLPTQPVRRRPVLIWHLGTLGGTPLTEGHHVPLVLWGYLLADKVLELSQ